MVAEAQAMHRHVARWLHRLGLTLDEPPDLEAWRELLGLTSALLDDEDQDRYLLEQSLEISSAEMTELYEELRATPEARLRIEREASQESRQRLNLLTEHSPVGIVEVDEHWSIRYANPAWCEIVGATPDTVEGPLLDRIVDRDQMSVRTELLQAVWQDRDLDVTARFRRRDDALRWLRVRGRRLPGTLRWILVMADVTDEMDATAALHDAQHALAEQATHDALTGLPNRVLVLDRLALALARSARHGPAVAVLYLDLDRFKIVNDSLGHDTGDLLLVQAASRILSCVRDTDTVARLGGDEFLVICETVESLAGIEGVAERILGQLAQAFDLAGREAFVSASVGIAISGPHDTPESLLRDADVAMYRAKESGRGRIEVFDAEMQAWASERQQTEVALRRAVAAEQLEVFYQPQVALPDADLVGVEALVRWRRPGHGIVSPVFFVGLAEETGLIGVLGEQVLREACRQVARWNRDRVQPLHLAVNVSARQLTQPGFVPAVMGVLEESALNPAWLALEITESVLVSDPDLARPALVALRRDGIRIAIDDFGAGYSSLRYLQDFPLDTIKIDRVFVRDLGVTERSREIVSAIVSLAHALHVDVVAEGVETAAELAVVNELGVDFAQGYFFSRPLERDELEGFLARTPGDARAPRHLRRVV